MGRRLRQVRTDAGVLLDLLGRLDQSRAASVLEDAVRESEPWVKLWGALGLIRGGRSVASEVFRQIAGWPECRITLARELESLERLDPFPNDFMNQPSLYEAAMVDWLLFPTELGRAPDEIRQLQSVPFETDDGVVDLYVFAFRTHSPHWLSDKDWVVGVAGPFLVSDQPIFEVSVLHSAASRACQRSLSTSTSKPCSEPSKAFPARKADPGPSVHWSKPPTPPWRRIHASSRSKRFGAAKDWPRVRVG